jgi:dUTP pyrophosphatase
MKILFKKLVPHAQCPSRGSNWSIGYDIYSAETVEIQPWSSVCISTGIAIEPTSEYSNDEWKSTTDTYRLKPDFYIRVAPRSGLALKNINVHAGVIDPDYRGEIKVILFNHNPNPFNIEMGNKIAQLIVERAVLDIQWEETEILGDTSRGYNGFGSTGI